jgi:hypothetical protein
MYIFLQLLPNSFSTNFGEKKQGKPDAGARATGIEPETAIQRGDSVTKHPHKPPLERWFVNSNAKTFAV